MKQAMFAAFMGIAVPAVALAQPPPGSEFRVNRHTTGVQQFPDVSADAQGNFVVVWEDNAQEDVVGVFARRFSSAGRALGPEFNVNAYTTGHQQVPFVAAAPDGRALVAWTGVPSDGGGGLREVFARRLDASGRPVGGEFQVNSYTTGLQVVYSVAADENGGFLVAWMAGAPQAAHATRIAPDGTPGPDISIGTFNVRSVDRRPGGGWLAVGDAGPPQDVFGVALDDAGAPAGPLFQVNTYTTGDQFEAKVEVDAAGGFVVVWQSQSPGVLDTVRVRRFDSQAQPLGPEFEVLPAASTPQFTPLVAVAPGGSFVVTWTDQTFFDWNVWMRRFRADGTPGGPELQVNVVADLLQIAGRSVVLSGGQIATAWTEAFVEDVSARQYGMIPQALGVDAAPDVSNGDGLLEPGETVVVEPAWANRDQVDWTVDGSAVSFNGPGSSALYAIVDGAARYGFMADGAGASCAQNADCFRVAVASGPRPAFHWDAALDERLSNGYSMRWTLHVGGSFADLAPGSAFARFVETLLHHGVTAGCAAGAYCPAADASREQMAVLVLSAHEGAGYQPRACGTPVFLDVPASSPYCRFIEELARRGVVSGCGGGNYCASSPVTRQEMPVFVLRTKEPAFTPPPCTTPIFTDVPVSSPFCPWIEELARRGVVSGCGGGRYCPADAVTREQMAVFLAVGFGLSLYGP